MVERLVAGVVLGALWVKLMAHGEGDDLCEAEGQDGGARGGLWQRWRSSVCSDRAQASAETAGDEGEKGPARGKMEGRLPDVQDDNPQL